MGLFTRKTQEEKDLEQKEKGEKYFEKYGLDLENYNVEEIRKRNADNLRKIASKLWGNTYYKLGVFLGGATKADKVKVMYLDALVEQNWVLMRQNEIMIKELQKLNSK